MLTVRAAPSRAGRLTFTLRPAPPFRLDLTAWVLRRRPTNLIDRWDGTTYRRVLLERGRPVEVAVSQTGSARAPRLRVTCIGRGVRPDRRAVTAALERLLGLRVDLRNFYRLAARDRQLSSLSRRLRGFKPGRYPTIFECLINAIACQQITLALGILLLSRLAERYGARFGPGAYAFPRPEDLADAAPEDLRALGFSRQKGKAIIMLAGDVAAGGLDLEALTLLDDDTAVERLRALPGIGRWSAEYVLLRGMGRLHAFPGDDVGARKNLERWLGLRRSLDYGGVRRILACWAPYGGLVYFHLLIDRLVQRGHLDSPGAG